jgi:hypothetical protein
MAENLAELETVYRLLHRHNPGCHLVLMLSPVQQSPEP